MQNSDFTRERNYLERKFVDPSFYDDAPGVPLNLLKTRLKQRFLKELPLPPPLAKADAFAELLDEVQVKLSPCDRFPGIAACPAKPLLGTFVAPRVEAGMTELFSPEEKQEIDRCNATRLAQLRADYEHSVPDWDAVLQLGFSGLLKRAEHYQRRYRETGPSSPEADAFFESIQIEYRAILHFLDRLIAEAEKLQPTPVARELTAALRQLRIGAPNTLYEALLQIWLYFQLSEYVDIIQTRSFGNLDRVLYPFYRHDLDSGCCHPAEIREIFRSFLYQMTAMHYKVGHPFYFGGTNPDGSSTINGLSFLILDVYDKLGIFDPKLQIKVSPQTPVAFLDKALDMIRRGRNSIAFVGEPCIRRAMLHQGYSQREADTADIKGCYEYCARGGTVETAPVTVNTVKILGLTLHNGVEPLSGRQLGPRTGEPEEFKTFGAFYKAFLRQLFYRYDRHIAFAKKLERHLDRFNPAPMLSATFVSSLEQAKDGYARGARYNNTNLWICGPATTADALTMIRRYVFERRELTLPQLVAMLDADWDGFDFWRRKLRNDPEKFGNNLDLPDQIARHFTEAIARRYHGTPNGRGGIHTVSLHSSNRFTEWAGQVEATADGRRCGDELSKNMTATQGSAWKGATALAASVLKLDSRLFMADLSVDIMLHPSEIRGENGLRAMRALLMAYVNHFGHAIHFNVMDADQLRQAQREPEKFRDLQVRICGWNVLWNSLSRKEQDAYIQQAER